MKLGVSEEMKVRVRFALASLTWSLESEDDGDIYLFIWGFFSPVAACLGTQIFLHFPESSRDCLMSYRVCHGIMPRVSVVFNNSFSTLKCTPWSVTSLSSHIKVRMSLSECDINIF